jgi:hypothetical protein
MEAQPQGDSMKTRNIAVVAALLLAGCAGQHVKLGDEQRRTLVSQPVYVVAVEPHAGFLVESTGYSAAYYLLSPLTMAVQMAESGGMQRDLALEDPVVRVRDRLLAALETHYKMTSVTRVAQPAGRLNPGALYRTLGSNGLVLEVGTAKWGIDNNRAKYAATARVFRLADDTVLWQAQCNDSIADPGKPGPASEALRANKGELLKAKMIQAADACADQLAAWAIEKAESR